jgi:nitrogenase subunit NifH
VRTYASNGVYLAGLVANLKDGKVDRKRLERFAKLIGTRILEVVPRDMAVREAEFARHKTAVERAPRSAFAKSVKSLAAKILAVKKEDCPVPTPMDDRRFYGAW